MSQGVIGQITAHVFAHPGRDDWAFRVMGRTVGVKRVKGRLVEYPTKIEVACTVPECPFWVVLERKGDIVAWQAIERQSREAA